MMKSYLILMTVLLQFIIIITQDAQTVIVNGLIANGKEGFEPFLGHILIGKNGKILNVIRETGTEGNEIRKKYQNIEIIDAKDKIVIPGGVDSGVKIISKVVIIFIQEQ